MGEAPRNPPPVGLEISIGGFRYTAPAVLLSDFYGNIAGSYECVYAIRLGHIVVESGLAKSGPAASGPDRLMPDGTSAGGS